MSGGFNPINLTSQIALAAATGGTSLIVSQIVQQVASKVLQEVIQQVGQELGLPQSAIDLAQGAAAGSMGDVAGAAQNYQEAATGAADLAGQYAEQLGSSPFEQARFEGDVQSAKDQLLESIRQNNPFTDEDGNVRGSGRGSVSGKSWLMALAAALGKQMDKAQAQFEAKMDSTDWEDSKSSMEMQAAAQEFSLFVNACNNVIKTIGEALTAMARKQ